MSRKTFYLDLAERSVWTFVQAFAAVWLVTQNFDMTNLKVAAAAGGVAVLKALVVNKLPWTATDSASTLPADVDPPVA
jgi:hypothetical protein